MTNWFCDSRNIDVEVDINEEPQIDFADGWQRSHAA